MRHRVLQTVALILVFGSMFWAIPVYADGNGPVSKLGRGAANIATGWLELPSEIGRQVVSKGDIPAIFAAPFIGAGKAVIRTFVGVFELVTWSIPWPKHYEPIVEPEFIFQKRD